MSSSLSTDTLYIRNVCMCCKRLFIRKYVDTLCNRCIKYNFDIRGDQHGNIIEFLIYKDNDHVWYPRIDQEIPGNYMCSCDLCDVDLKREDIIKRGLALRFVDFNKIDFYK